MRILGLFLACMTAQGSASTLLAKARVLEAFTNVIVLSGATEVLSAEQASRRDSISPIGSRCVFDRKLSEQRLGIITSLGRLEQVSRKGGLEN